MFDDTVAGKHAVQSFPATQVIDDAKKEQAAGMTESSERTWTSPELFSSFLVEVENFLPEIRTISVIWLLVWNMAFIFPYIENNNPNWLSYLSEG